MRPIKFRGRDRDGNLHVGNLDALYAEGILPKHSPHFLRTYIVPRDYGGRSVEVLPETVCQATGRLDIEGRMIFEGDTVLFEDDGGELWEGYIRYLEGDAAFVVDIGSTSLFKFISSGNDILIIPTP